MPAPVVPPPANDVGAQPFPRRLQRWLDVWPATKLDRIQTYITLPAFNINVNWLGYSDIVGAFNVEGPNNFSLKALTNAPSNPNYMLCVMWKDSSNNVYRYAIWQNVGEVVYFNIPLYTGQKIGKNFRFEIWSTNVAAVSQDTSINLYTSVLGGFDYRWSGDTALVNPDPIVTAFSCGLTGKTLPPANNSETWMTASQGIVMNPVIGGIDTWTQYAGAPSAVVFTEPTGGIDQVVIDNTLAVPSPVIQFTNALTNLNATPPGGYAPKAAIWSLRVTPTTPLGTLIDSDFGWTLHWDGVSTLAFSGGSVDITAYIDKWVVGIIQYVDAAHVSVSVYDMQSGTLINTQTGLWNSLSASTIVLKNYNWYISDMIWYSTALTSDDIQQILNYFTSTYNKAFPVPITFPANSTPQPN